MVASGDDLISEPESVVLSACENKGRTIKPLNGDEHVGSNRAGSRSSIGVGATLHFGPPFEGLPQYRPVVEDAAIPALGKDVHAIANTGYRGSHICAEIHREP